MRRYYENVSLISMMRHILSETANSKPSAAVLQLATSSMATEMVKGKTIEEAMKLTNKAVMEALDGTSASKGTLLPSCRRGCTCCTVGLCTEAPH